MNLDSQLIRNVLELLAQNVNPEAVLGLCKLVFWNQLSEFTRNLELLDAIEENNPGVILLMRSTFEAAEV